MRFGDKSASERLPRPRIVLLLGVVKRIAASPGDDVNNPLRSGLQPAIEDLIQRPVARHLVGITNRLAVPVFIGLKLQGIRSLIVMNMSTEYDIDPTRLENLGQKPHLLVSGVRLGGIKAGVMERDKPP